MYAVPVPVPTPADGLGLGPARMADAVAAAAVGRAREPCPPMRTVSDDGMAQAVMAKMPEAFQTIVNVPEVTLFAPPK